MQDIRGWIVDYLAEAGEIGLQEAGNLGAKNNTLIYKGGALAALLLDLRLRIASRNKRSLDEVMATLLKDSGPERRQPPRSRLEELVQKIGGKSTKSFFVDHIDGKTPLPLAHDLAEIGLLLTQETIAVPTIHDVAVTLIRCPGMVIENGGIRVQRTEAPGLEAHDLLLEVAGKAVHDYDALCHALHRFGPGDKVPVVLERQGQRRSLALKLGGDDSVQIPREERSITELEVKPLKDRRKKIVRETIFQFEQG